MHSVGPCLLGSSSCSFLAWPGSRSKKNLLRMRVEIKISRKKWPSFFGICVWIFCTFHALPLDGVYVFVLLVRFAIMIPYYLIELVGLFTLS